MSRNEIATKFTSSFNLRTPDRVKPAWGLKPELAV